MKPSSTTRPRTRQTGYALLLMVVALMGVGGVVMSSFTQGAKQETEHQRYLHNQRVLNEAKQALLQYAYNYPVNNPLRGPGRLPCPDMNNDGSPDPSFNCISGTAMVGRFPWGDPQMNFYDARDASGARLWYAVSKNFANTISPAVDDVINSDTNGTIAIEDRSGALLYPATFPADVFGAGVAAVIFAPGAAIARGGVKQDRAADPNDPTNYLDLFGTIDNADFVNGTANGFVTGPIFNPVDGSLAVNDQMIVITAAEVITMAEKATLQAYRQAINDYLDSVACNGETPTGSGTTEVLCLANGGSWDPVYPWLYNYDGIEYDTSLGQTLGDAIDKLSRYFPAFSSFTDEKNNNLGIDPDGIFGRIPSIFANYFTETNSIPFDSKLEGALEIDYAGLTVGSTASGDQVFNDAVQVLEFSTSNVLTEVQFIDIADFGSEKNGRLAVTVPSLETFTAVFYFWDGRFGAETGRWTACPNGGDEISDCWRDGSGNPDPGGFNGNREQILRVELSIQFNPGDVFFDADYTVAPTITVTRAASGTGHAMIEGAFLVNNMDTANLPPITATYEIDPSYLEDTVIPPHTEIFNGSVSGNLAVADLLLGGTLKLGLRYFPVLPAWALDNGWHNAMRMAYAHEYEPGGTGPCIIDSSCLHLVDSATSPQDKVSLLVIAAQHNWQDSDSDGRLRDELETVFDNGNHNDNPSFYRHRGNDKILVIDEL
ncbi:MAG: hypothetical protein LJE92_01545 [Gammaproteobacteria bacterium]|nr:hypothetical protein [Gammaproteobacteria bacterium]